MYQSNHEYLDKYHRRILYFAWVTMAYLLTFFTYTVVNLFMNLNWQIEIALYSYCVYSIWFNSYSLFRYLQYSREEEKKQDVALYQAIGLSPFDHKRSRRNMFKWSALALLVNIALIVVTFLNVI